MQFPVVQKVYSAIHREITIQWITQKILLRLIHQIVIYPVDSAIHFLNNRGQDCKERSGLQFLKFDFVTGGQEIKTAILWNFGVYSRNFVFS